jgi:hypothetical protein
MLTKIALVVVEAVLGVIAEALVVVEAVLVAATSAAFGANQSIK